jgi:hypothetical protein
MTMTIDEVRDSYVELVMYRRPGRSATEEQFIQDFIDPLGCLEDDFGNRYIRIGYDPVLWSCHTDTVHREEGTQTVRVLDNRVQIGGQSKGISNCLGADCTTGVWIMIQMIKAKKPGLYVFHRDEESGGQGSNWIARNHPEFLKDIKFAIAFDRYGTTSIITHQGGRSCSDDFADSMIEQMPGYRKDPGGVFTDTAFYTDLIPECTNVSVGYLGHHGSGETQDLVHMNRVLELMLDLDISKLRESRDPSVQEIYTNHKYSWSDWYGEGYEGFDDFMTPDEKIIDVEEKSMLALVKANPNATVSLLRLYGIGTQELLEHAFAETRGYGT